MLESYQFIEELYEEKKTLPIKITSGPYANTIYRYTIIGVRDAGKGEALISFDFEILNKSHEFDHTTDVPFQETLKEILQHLIAESADDNRENDIT
jgi:hypothetical protein